MAKRVCGTRSIKDGVNDSAGGDPHHEPALRVVVAKLNAMVKSPVKLVDGTRSRSCVAIQDLGPHKGKQENQYMKKPPGGWTTKLIKLASRRN